MPIPIETIDYRGTKLIPPKYDRMFKAVFVDEDLTPLASFLSSVLDMDILASDLRVMNPELPVKSSEDKQVRLDIKIKLADKSIVNVEMQVGNEYDMGKRSLHNLSRLMAGGLKRGKKRNEIYPVIAINVLDFNYITDEEGFHNRFRMKNVKTNAEMPNAEVFEINFIELPKLPKNAGNGMKELWVKFLSAKTEEELNMLAKQAPALKKAVHKLVRVNASEERQYMEDMLIKAEIAEYYLKKGIRAESLAEGIAVGKTEGIAVGRTEGKAEGKAEIIAIMKAKGWNSTQIAELVGMTVDEVERTPKRKRS
ncbi:MAG: Rpn family recombination-promoting nuclease/putative transposase [Chitinispirillales bacterium]|jgi:predicted transposase/invertase (TIGR01784 family)|nr:Rpn family recombination-promoting nuclease/putative transposase [Chitinispirillales bacterium]